MKNKGYKNLAMVFCLLGTNLCEIKAGTSTLLGTKNLTDLPDKSSINLADKNLTPLGTKNLTDLPDKSLINLANKSLTLLVTGSLTSQRVKDFIQKNGVLETYAQITAMVEEALRNIKDNIDWINDLIERINKTFRDCKEMASYVRELNEKLEILNNSYRTCTKELSHEPRGNCSLVVNVINDLKELQDASQYLRISAVNLLTAIKQLASQKTEFQILIQGTGGKLEVKLIDQHGTEITETTNRIIEVIIVPAKEAYSEFSFEERGSGRYKTQSTRALSPTR